MKYLVIPNFLTKEQCNELINMGERKMMMPATGVNAETGKFELTEYRKAETSFLSIAENPLIDDIEHRIASITNLPIENGEGMQVIKYRPGGYYKQHHDAFDYNFKGNRDLLAHGGNRIYTFICYLNDVEGGGETYFPRVKLRVKPQVGKAIFWKNIKDDGSIDIDTLHSGEPLTGGEGSLKYILTKWIRERKYV